MACRTFVRSVFLTEPRPPLLTNPTHFPPPLRNYEPCLNLNGQIVRAPYLHFAKRTHHHRHQYHLNCTGGDSQLASSTHDDQGPPQEAVLKAISEVSKTEGRVGQTTNVVIGGTVADDSTNEWLALDQKVNSYPTVRGFTAIGTGGDDFVHAMVVAVESVLQQPIPEERVKQKLSSRGKYVSVNIGPVQVISSEQVQAVYNAMRRDDRMKYFL